MVAKWRLVTRVLVLPRILAQIGLPPSHTHGQALVKIFERVSSRIWSMRCLYTIFRSSFSRSPNARPAIRTSSTATNSSMRSSRFEAQMIERSTGNEEVPPPDWDFHARARVRHAATAGSASGWIASSCCSPTTNRSGKSFSFRCSVR